MLQNYFPELPNIFFVSLELDVSYLMLLKKLYTGVFQGKSCKLKCGLAKWPNIHTNLKNEQLEFLQPIFENCLPNGFNCNYELEQLLLQIKVIS